MSRKREILLFLAHAGMEVSWLYAWAVFLMAAMGHPAFPLMDALAGFMLGAMLTGYIKEKGLRIITVWGLQGAGLVVGATRILYASYSQTHSYLDPQWLIGFLHMTRDPLEWLVLVVILSLALGFWFSGVTLVRRSTAYLSLCTRFDLGVSAFFCLLLIKFLLRTKGGIELQDPGSEILVFPFLIFSLLTIGLARNRGTARKEFLSGYRAMGALLTFIGAVMVFGSGLVLLLMPYLHAGAEMGYGALKSAAAPLVPVLIRVLRFIFLGRRLRSEPSSSSSDQNEGLRASPSEEGWGDEPVEIMLTWGLSGLGALLGLILLGLGTWYLIRWLFSRTGKRETPKRGSRRFLVWIQGLWTVILQSRQWLIQQVKGAQTAHDYFGFLLRWGRHSGLPRLKNETPLEYGLRLMHYFPSIKREIALIIYAFNLETYGQTPLDDPHMSRVRQARKRLHSPVHWPARLKSWFLQPGKQAEESLLNRP